RSIVFLPESPDRTLIRNEDLAVLRLFINVRTGALVKIGVQAGIAVVLHAIVLPAQAIVEHQLGCYLPTILGIDIKVSVAIAPCVVGRVQRWSHGAGRTLDYVAELI